MKKISEIFYSLQGEGAHSGYPCVFVRFSGCNLNCSFCDTNHNEGTYMDDESIIRSVKLYSADWIVLTGGEPTLFIDEEFVSFLKRATGKKIAIETNGTRPVPPSVDWVTVSPKSGFSGAGEARVVADRASELKVVDLGQDLEPYFSLPCVKEDTRMYLQPCYVPNQEHFRMNRLSTVKRVLADPRWTLSIQLHRYLQIP
ncbi:MAG: radical SAM protein [Bacteroidales bacterium]|nr:radical SAM protein [Bacteroidales bacterium]